MGTAGRGPGGFSLPHSVWVAWKHLPCPPPGLCGPCAHGRLPLPLGLPHGVAARAPGCGAASKAISTHADVTHAVSAQGSDTGVREPSQTQEERTRSHLLLGGVFCLGPSPTRLPRKLLHIQI